MENVSAEMVAAAKAYGTAKRALTKAERANAGKEDLRPVNVKRAAVGHAEEAMVLRMVAELSITDPSKRDKLYAMFNRSRSSVVYWPKVVRSALAYAGAP